MALMDVVAGASRPASRVGMDLTVHALSALAIVCTVTVQYRCVCGACAHVMWCVGMNSQLVCWHAARGGGMPQGSLVDAFLGDCVAGQQRQYGCATPCCDSCNQVKQHGL
jgi:hypothetical protein